MYKVKKEPRRVEIPEDSVLDFGTYDELRSHALRSTMWYLNRFNSHSSKLRQRLFDKGYPDVETRYIDYDGEEKTVHIVNDVISDLIDQMMIDDGLYISSKIKSGISRGKGISLIARELKFKGIPEDEVSSAVDEFELNNESIQIKIDSIQKAAEKALRTSAFKKSSNSWQSRMVLSNALRAKGFDSASIDEWIENNSEILEG